MNKSLLRTTLGVCSAAATVVGLGAGAAQAGTPPNSNLQCVADSPATCEQVGSTGARDHHRRR